MKHLILAILTIPPLLVFLTLAIRILANLRHNLPLWLSFIPLLSLATSVALVFAFPKEKFWKVAVAVNSIPFVLLLLLSLVLVG